jgi:hypothetical protein
MISFIKFIFCHSVFPAAAQTGRSVCFVLLVNLALNLIFLTGFSVCFCRGIFVVHGWVVFSSVSVLLLFVLLIFIC